MKIRQMLRHVYHIRNQRWRGESETCETGWNRDCGDAREAIKKDGRIIVCLGGTESQAAFGPAFRLTRQRGIPLEHRWAPHALATIHPSAILRAPDDEARHAEYARFVEDLKKITGFL